MRHSTPSASSASVILPTMPNKGEYINRYGESSIRIAGQCVLVFGVFILLWQVFSPPASSGSPTRTACLQSSCIPPVTP